ncbi:ABC transporter permease [Streptococcus iners]|uniref:ABC transporter permease n=1 Tax=Streptococcus iners TaxID=3028084 RepID=A0AA96VIN9_9STRE|nr:ABC transporter permease [Streptococcus sp. 29887]MCK4026202.1 ABC transporter permease [Streptococcus suis]WNY50545.1 ABC transporter permease [Streptococcus sp. 29887]
MLKGNKRLLILGFILLAWLVLMYVLPYFFTDSITKVDLGHALQGPSQSEWFGTDALGRSVFARVMSGGRESIFSGLLVLFTIVTIGSLIGISSGLVGGKVDQVILLIITAFQAFPAIVLVIAIVGILGVGLQQTVLAMCMVAWTKYAYLTRSITLQLKEESYIKSAKMYGNGFLATITNYYIPMIKPQILTTMSFDIGIVIMEISGLSFIGLGAQVPSPEWGTMINDGRIYIQEAPWIVIFPCIMLMITILLFTKFGDELKKHYNNEVTDFPLQLSE